jgi:hypothetical protein
MREEWLSVGRMVSTYCGLRSERGSYNVAITGFTHRAIYSCLRWCAIVIKA